MTNIEKLHLANQVHELKRQYREVLDQSHADIGLAIQQMPEGTSFTPAELAAAAGVVYQVLNCHTADEKRLTRNVNRKTKKYAAILPDGTIDMSQTIKVTKDYVTYTVNGCPCSMVKNRTSLNALYGKPDYILAAIQRKEGER